MLPVNLTSLSVTCSNLITSSTSAATKSACRLSAVDICDVTVGGIQLSDWLNANVPHKCAATCVSSANGSTEQRGEHVARLVEQHVV